MFKQVLEKAGTASMRAKMTATAVMVPVVSALVPMVSHAAEGDVSSGVSHAVDAVTGLSSLFTMYPMNIFLGCSVAIAGFKVFKSGKRAAR